MTRDPLHRLLRAASLARSGPQEPPHGMEGRVLAAWRIHETPAFDAMIIVRPALIAAFALACVIGALAFDAISSVPDPATDAASAAFLTSMN